MTAARSSGGSAPMGNAARISGAASKAAGDLGAPSPGCLAKSIKPPVHANTNGSVSVILNATQRRRGTVQTSLSQQIIADRAYRTAARTPMHGATTARRATLGESACNQSRRPGRVRFHNAAEAISETIRTWSDSGVDDPRRDAEVRDWLAVLSAIVLAPHSAGPL